MVTSAFGTWENLRVSDLGNPGQSTSFDHRPVAKRIGLILLATDHTTERDFSRLTSSARIGVYANRIAYENPTTPENLQRTMPRLAEGAGTILPGEALDAICYSCTAASVVIGDAAVEAAIHSTKPGVPVITPISAARAALRVLGARRISVLTPYLPETSVSILEHFESHGFDPINLTCWGIDDDRVMARVSPDTIVETARTTIKPGAEALFISCTAVRAAEVAERIESEIGIPVVTSNQASVWMTLRKAGVEDAIHGAGRLLSLPFVGD